MFYASNQIIARRQSCSHIHRRRHTYNSITFVCRTIHKTITKNTAETIAKSADDFSLVCFTFTHIHDAFELIAIQKQDKTQNDTYTIVACRHK